MDECRLLVPNFWVLLGPPKYVCRKMAFRAGYLGSGYQYTYFWGLGISKTFPCRTTHAHLSSSFFSAKLVAKEPSSWQSSVTARELQLFGWAVN